MVDDNDVSIADDQLYKMVKKKVNTVKLDMYTTDTSPNRQNDQVPAKKYVFKCISTCL